jgi:hypothetical protein
MRQINFSEELRYDGDRNGISLMITLMHQGNEMTVPAKIDTGADVCLFSHEIGVALGIPIEQGEYLLLGGLPAPSKHMVTESRSKVATSPFRASSTLPNIRVSNAIYWDDKVGCAISNSV